MKLILLKYEQRKRYKVFISSLSGILIKRGVVINMYYSRKNQEPPIQEETEIWECTKEECKGWMRKDFSYDSHQKCPLCKSQMKTKKRLIDKISRNLHKK